MTTTRITKIEKKEKKTHLAMKIRYIPLVAFIIIMIGIFTTATTITTTISQAYAQANEGRAVNEFIPLEGTIIDATECENGELIEVSGDVHIVGRSYVDETGGHVVGHVNFQNVRGEGLTSGNDYRVPYAFSSTTNFNIRFDTVQATGTETTSFQLISEGESAPDLLVHAQFHITLNANGEVTAQIENLSRECR